MHVIVDTGIKGLCYHCRVCKANEWGSITLRYSGSLYLLKLPLKCYYRHLLLPFSGIHTQTHNTVREKDTGVAFVLVNVPLVSNA